MKRNYFFIVAVLVLATSMVGCNMLRGAGKDVENAGTGIQRTVNHND
jgi:predicted small secreted protein